jgi:uncharacterized membrane protein YkoI
MQRSGKELVSPSFHPAPVQVVLSTPQRRIQMTKRTKLVIVGASALALAAGGAGIAGATGGGDDSEAPIAGKALDKASAAALEATGGGAVSETEVGDEESYYEVEVTQADGGQVDVQLDRDFDVVGQSADEESPDDGSR